MGFDQRSWIAAALLPDEVADKVVEVRSEMVLYGSTSGPFGGISGAAMTYFQITVIGLPNLVLVFADDRLLGWSDDSGTAHALRSASRLAVIKDTIPAALEPADACPVPPRERITP